MQSAEQPPTQEQLEARGYRFERRWYGEAITIDVVVLAWKRVPVRLSIQFTSSAVLFGFAGAP